MLIKAKAAGILKEGNWQRSNGLENALVQLKGMLAAPENRKLQQPAEGMTYD